MKILVATKNPGKLTEYRRFFESLPIEFVSLEDVGITEEAPEDGETLQENAIQKVEFYGEKSGLMTVADDTGFFVDGLNGAPGVHAKRFGKTDEERIAKVLDGLKDVPKEQRTAYFETAAALFDPETKQSQLFEGRVDGLIPEEMMGEIPHGHTYDPIFYHAEKDMSFAQMTTDQKGEVSHRGIAFRKLKKHLEGLA